MAFPTSVNDQITDSVAQPVDPRSTESHYIHREATPEEIINAAIERAKAAGDEKTLAALQETAKTIAAAGGKG